MTLRYLDPRLALAVEAAHAASVGPLTRLAAPELGIRRLGGIEQLTQLRELDLAGNPISRVLELGALTELRRLELARTSVASVDGLDGLPALVDLDLGGTPLSELDPLAGLPLRSLDLGGCPVRELRPLASLARLEALTLGSASVELGRILSKASAREIDLAPIRSLGRLRKLHLGGLVLREAHVLDALVTLDELILDSSELADRLVSLPALPRVELLVLRDCEGISLRAVAELPRLRELVLDMVEVADLSPLLGCATLERVRLIRTTVGDRGSVARLREHPGLVELQIDDTVERPSRR